MKKLFLITMCIIFLNACTSKEIVLVSEDYNPIPPLVVVSKGKCGFLEINTIVKLKDGNGRLFTVVDNSLKSVQPGDILK